MNQLNHKDFMRFIIMYYGKYPDHGENYFFNSVYTYIKQNFLEAYLPALLEITKRRFPAQYKIPPDIYFFEKIYREVLESPVEDGQLRLSDFGITEEERQKNLKELQEIKQKCLEGKKP